MKYIWLMLVFVAVELSISVNGYSAAPFSGPPCTLKGEKIFQEARTCSDQREGSLSTKDLTVAGFSIGRSSLEDVERRLPGTSKFRLTSEEESPIGICVRNRLGHAVVFASGYTGGWKVLDSIYMAPSKTFEKQGAKCATVKSIPDKLATASGIRLGMSSARVLSLLQSPPSKNSAFQVSFSAKPERAPWVSRHIRPTEGSGWTAMSGAMGEFKAGKLRWIALYGGVSN